MSASPTISSSLRPASPSAIASACCASTRAQVCRNAEPLNLIHDIAYWMVDDDYDGSNFVVRQVFFCGGDKDDFDDWKKGLSAIAQAATKKKAEQTLKVQIDDEAFTRIYGHTSHPFPARKGQKIAVRVISQFGEESMKVLTV